MLVRPFETPQFNKHCEGTYSDKELDWRRIGAIDKVSNVQALLRTEKVQSILDVGCGTGAVLSELVKRGIGTSHKGIDLTAPGIHVDPGAKHLSLVEYDGETIPFPDDSFDFVYASHVVEHVLNPRGFIAEISRVAKRFIYLGGSLRTTCSNDVFGHAEHSEYWAHQFVLARVLFFAVSNGRFENNR
jgi:SAM-dependent methyltransferase